MVGHQPRWLVLIAVAATAALGVGGGLSRLGWPAVLASATADLHGPIMVCGVLGAVIGLERAVAWRQSPYWAGPLLCIAGTLAALCAFPTWAAAGYLAAAAILAAGCAVQVCREPGASSAGAFLAACAWSLGCAIWAHTGSSYDASGWWLSFLVLTVLAERLDMSRLFKAAYPADVLFGLGVSANLLGNLLGWHGRGALLWAASLLLLIAATLPRDVARLNIRRSGEVRYFAVCMLAGYGWLLAAAGMFAVGAAPEASLHAVTLGFILSMIFGHVLIILPAVAKVRPRYHPALYAPLALLQAAVAARVAGSVLPLEHLRLASGLMAIGAMILNVGLFAWSSGSPATTHGRGVTT